MDSDCKFLTEDKRVTNFDNQRTIYHTNLFYFHFLKEISNPFGVLVYHCFKCITN